MTLSEYSVKKPLSTIIMIAVIVLFGLFSLGQLPLLFLPETSFPNLFVVVPYKSTSPTEIKNLITIPVEGALGGIKNVDSVTSTTTGSSANIRMAFAIGTDMDLATAEIRDRLDQILPKLPDGVGNIRVRRFQTTDLPILRLNVGWAGDNAELYRLVEDILAPRVLRIEGVADVDVSGIRTEEISVELDAIRMGSLGISMGQINQSLRANNLTLSAGTISEDGRNFIVRSVGEFSDVSEIAALPIKGTDAVLGDVGRVEYGFPEPTRVQRLNSQDSVALSVYKNSSANVVDVSNRVKQALLDIGGEEELQAMSIRIFFDQAKEITNSLSNLRNAGIIGALLAVLMLYVFMGKIRTTLIIGLSIPISVVFTFAIMYLVRRGGMDLSLNIISLSGLMLAIGMLVDNSVVVMENIYRHRELGTEPRQAAIAGSKEVAMPVFAATLTSIIVFVPLLFTANTSFGRFMRDFGLSIVSALVASLLVSLTLIPLVSSRLFTGGVDEKHRFLDYLGKKYQGVMRWSLSHRVITLAIVGAVFGGAMVLFSLIGREFTPPAPARNMSISISVPREYDIYDVRDIFDGVETTLLENQDELEIATLSTDFRASGGRLSVYFKDLEDSKLSTADLTNQVRTFFPEIPGVTFTVGKRWGLGGGQSGVSVDLKGPDTGVLGIYADTVATQLKNVGGLTDMETNLESGAEELQVVVDRRKARSYGFSSLNVAQSISTILSDSTSASFKSEDREIPIRVSLKDEDVLDLEGLRNYSLESPDGDIPVGTLVDMSIQPGPNTIRRENGSEILSVSADTERSNIQNLQNEIKSTLGALQMPPGYSWEMGSSFRKWQQAQQTSTFAIALAVVFVYIVIASLFESFAHPITILFSVPFSLIGVAVLFYITGTTLNNNSWLGIMVLFGVVVNNAIILIDHINRLRAQGKDRRTAILEGGRDRLRPILITAMTTLLGLFPLVAPLLFPTIFGPIEGRANQYGPIALALVGGLTTSTFLTLIITPTIYALMDDLVIFLKKVAHTTRRPARIKEDLT